ncbi:MAG: flagellar basal-body rod protein FlgG [Phycisphaerales bacterium]
MAIIALHSASTALSALSTSLDITANNLANANTDGFKSSRANFQDLMYQERSQPGVENANGDQRPTGLYVGLGTKISGTQIDFAQGGIRPTERPFDFNITGEGFFQVEVDTETSETGLAYTRAGNFARNADGELVLATDQGRRLDPPIVVPENASGIDIRSDGTVVAQIGGAEPEELGQIELAKFVNPTGLRQVGENLYAPSAASGAAVTGPAGTNGTGTVSNGALEGSNVNPVNELVGLILTQRAFELNSQSIQAADEVLRTAGQLRSF